MLFLLVLILLLPALTGWSEIFQGEVVHVDRSQGNFTVQSRSRTGALEQRVFVLSNPGVNPSGTLSEVDIGEEIQVEAVNQNGIWQVQNLFVSPLTPTGTTGVRVIGENQRIAFSANQTEDVFAPSPTRFAAPGATFAQADRNTVFLTPVPGEPGAFAISNIPSTVSGTGNINNGSSANIAGTVSATPTGVGTFNSSFNGTTVTSTRAVRGAVPMTSSGGTGATSTGPGSTTNSGAAGVPTRSGAQGTSQSL